MNANKDYTFNSELEGRFAVYLQKELGYKKTKLRKNILGKSKFTGKHSDIVAEKTYNKRELFLYLSNFAVYAGIVLIVFALSRLFGTRSVDLGKIGMYLIVSGTLGLFFIWSFIPNERALFDCKSSNEKTNILMIDTFLHQVSEDKKNGCKDFRRTTLFFVSALGYIEEADIYAAKKGIRCFVLNEKNEFVESEYHTIS